MVEDDVGRAGDALCVEGLNRRQVSVLGAILGGHGPFLIELAQVVQVVDAVADVVDSSLPLVGGREPDDADAEVGDRRGVVGEVAPVACVGSHVPGEGLQDQRAGLVH